MRAPVMKRAGATGAGAANALVLLHGRGGDAEDMLGLFAAAALPNTAAIAPQAPGNSWWPTSFLAPTAQIAPHLAAALAQVAGAVATLEAEGLPRHRIWLAGFSQGAGLALEAFARQGAGLAGALGFSGALIGTADAPGAADPALYGYAPKAFDYSTNLSGARVWLSVHERDPHIPLARSVQSAGVFKSLGAEITQHTYPGAGHSVMREDLATLRGWLNTARP